MNLGKFINKDTNNSDGILRQALILGILAFIVMGFGNGFPGAAGGPFNGQADWEPDYNHERYKPIEPPRRKKHKSHHALHNERAHVNIASVEENNIYGEENLNPPYAPYTIE